MSDKLRLDEIFELPDGSGFATASLPLPKDHWIYVEGLNTPPMPMRTGTDSPFRSMLNEMVWAAGKYAVRCATMNGTAPDFDPDALVQNLVVGLLGYHSPDALGFEPWMNPDPIPAEFTGPKETLHPDEMAALPRIITSLKQADGEAWAVGDFLERYFGVDRSGAQV